MTSKQQNPIFTIGHSTLPVEKFIALLHQEHITTLADVRTIPGSNAFPQYHGETLAATLAQADIRYVYLPELGGRRGKQAGISPDLNAYWENKSFRYYADYATTPAFGKGLEALEEIARAHLTAFMCAEAVWWRCHRRIITDHLLARDWTVRHLLATGRTEEAHLTPGAVVKRTQVTYPLRPGETKNDAVISTSSEE